MAKLDTLLNCIWTVEAYVNSVGIFNRYRFWSEEINVGRICRRRIIVQFIYYRHVSDIFRNSSAANSLLKCIFWNFATLCLLSFPNYGRQKVHY